uniref:Integral membrane protein n=1 Tax=uncultured Thiotrichaceae bacterium TaxID=298394 RepID=A0A6S6UMS9_9GAMM|nr:MAG: Integral membrane protein [uncultured Thiotrichaceae bacterium]
MNENVSNFIKGLAMGAANVIPGVSGGTVALVTGIYERLINALKSCDLNALKLLFARDFKGAWEHIDGRFLSAILGGVAVSIVSLAKVLEYLLGDFEVLTMAFFFGLIVVSIISVGRTVKQWGVGTLLALVLGTALAVSVAMLAPAGENANAGYLFLCGVVAICSMILPGLSGSFVLIIMGNYALVLGAVGRFDMGILLPMALGCGLGLLAFAHVLAWVYAKFHDQTVAMMTGFILGSLAIVWPWKNTLTEVVSREGKADKLITTGYEWFVPTLGDSSTLMALGLMVVGGLMIWGMEKVSRQRVF